MFKPGDVVYNTKEQSSSDGWTLPLGTYTVIWVSGGCRFLSIKESPHTVYDLDHSLDDAAYSADRFTLIKPKRTIWNRPCTSST